jgi:hypothetical protein
MLALRKETKRLAALPAPGFAPQITFTVAGVILLVSAAPTNSVTVAILLTVLMNYIAGTTGTQEDLGRVRKRLALIKTGLKKATGFPKKQISLESARLSQPFILVSSLVYTPQLQGK